MAPFSFMIQSFPPLISHNPKTLILGSMPGDASLSAGEYYTNPRNQFWKIISHLLENKPTPPSYPEKIAMLQRHQIALWDVLESCDRKGSLDSNIRNVRLNDFASFLQQHKSINLIVFNGQLAHKYFSRYMDVLPGVSMIVLPSTSPAHTLSLEKKTAAWAEIFR